FPAGRNRRRGRSDRFRADARLRAGKSGLAAALDREAGRKPACSHSRHLDDEPGLRGRRDRIARLAPTASSSAGTAGASGTDWTVMSRRGPLNVVVTGVTVSGNMGGTAMLITAMQEIARRAPGSRFTLLSYTPKADRAASAIPGLTIVSADYRF